MTNVVKHAQAKTMHIIFACRERSVILTVEDDGRGFSRAQVAGAGLGLVGMRERVASVNGALDIESRHGAGTRLTVEIPLAESAAGLDRRSRTPSAGSPKSLERAATAVAAGIRSR